METTAVIQKFRSALGGFNRQDVQQYIEQISAGHRQELEQLQERLDRAEAESAELKAARSAVEAERDSAAAEAAQAAASLEESSRVVSRLRGELSQADAKLRVAKQELEQLKAQVNTLEPKAAGYDQLKDRIANVELDAHRKAQDTVSQAQEEADRVQADTREWLEGVLVQYGQLRQGMAGLLEQVKLLSRDSESLGALDDTAQALRRRGGVEK